MTQTETTYTIPARYRKMENLHIFFWLFKDISWCLLWKPLGIVMIAPTLFIAILISVRNHKNISETCHNIAIVFWIVANSYWMISEFLEFDEVHITGAVTYKHIAVIPFAIGITVLLYYYLLWKPMNPERDKTV